MSQQDPEQLQGTPPAAPAPAVEAPVAQPAERQVDLAYVAQLENFARQQQAELNRYETVKDDVAWMLEDESRLEGVRRYKNAYTEAAKPKFDPNIEPVIEYVKNELAPVREWVDTQKQATQRQQQAETQKFLDENRTYANRLIAEKKLQPGKELELAAYADSLALRFGRNVGLEEAYKTITGWSGGPKVEAAAAPVLRADEGAVGVPGPSHDGSKRWVNDFGGWLTDALTAEKRTA